MKRAALILLAAGTLQSAAGGLSVQLFPFDFQTASLGSGYYSLIDQVGLKVTAYSDQSQAIAPQAGIDGRVRIDLNHLPSRTLKAGPHTYVLTEQGVTLIIDSAAPLTILPPVAHPTVSPVAPVTAAKAVQALAGTVPPVNTDSETVEVRNRELTRLPGLPRELTGSVNVTQTQETVTFSYSLINLGSKSYSLDVDDLTLSQDGHPIKARLERKNGSLTPGLLAGSKGEIGRISVPRISSAPIELRWTLRSGDATYTLHESYTPE